MLLNQQREMNTGKNRRRYLEGQLCCFTVYKSVKFSYLTLWIVILHPLYANSFVYAEDPHITISIVLTSPLAPDVCTHHEKDIIVIQN